MEFRHFCANISSIFCKMSLAVVVPHFIPLLCLYDMPQSPTRTCMRESIILLCACIVPYGNARFFSRNIGAIGTAGELSVNKFYLTKEIESQSLIRMRFVRIWFSAYHKSGYRIPMDRMP